MPVIGEDGLAPTQKGISLNISQYHELLEAIRELGEVMSNEKEVARIRKSKKEEIRIGINTFINQPLIYIRTFAKYDEDDEFKPTKRGISIKVDLFPRLLEAVEKLGAEIEIL